jgi:HEAT repeat protein
LDDSNVAVRRSALAVVAARAGGIRFSGAPDHLNRWNEDRPALRGLRPFVINVLDDADERNRRDAIIALGNLDFADSGKTAGEVMLSDATVQLLADRYSVEPSAIVRAEIVKSLALIENRTGVQEIVIQKALYDSSDSVLQYAAMGAGRLRTQDSLPRLVELILTHANRAVRLNAVQALAKYGSDATSQLPVLRGALPKEQDAVVRSTLDAVIKQLETR